MNGSPLDDITILRILDMIERLGLSASDVGEVVGRSRSSVLGIVKRVRDDLAFSEAGPFAPCTGPAVRVGNRDGDLPPRWWARPELSRRYA